MLEFSLTDEERTLLESERQDWLDRIKEIRDELNYHRANIDYPPRKRRKLRREAAELIAGINSTNVLLRDG